MGTGRIGMGWTGVGLTGIGRLWALACMAALLAAGAATSSGAPLRATAGTPDVLLTGRVELASPQTRYAVTVEAWPSAEVLAGMPADREFRLLRTGRVVHLGDGAFEVHDTGLPDDYVQDDLLANLQVSVTFDGRQLSTEVPVLAPRSAGGLALRSDPEQLAGHGLDGVPSLDVAIHDRDRASIRRVGSWGRGTAAVRHTVRPMSSSPSCPRVWKAREWHHGRPERFMHIHSWAGAPATVTQTAGAVHELGVATRLPGQRRWSAGGSMSRRTTNSTVDVTAGLHDRAVYNKVNYRRFEHGCGAQQVRPIDFHTLTSHTRPIADRTFTLGCYRKSSGSFEMRRTRNVTHTRGVDVVGIRVSAQSGWTRQNSVRFDIRQRSLICGNSPRGTVHATQVSVQPG